ncbi:MAG: isopentenyl-diphosphate Delta-isomerase [Calditrichia bacterium]
MTDHKKQNPTVSFDDEKLILVNPADEVIGYKDKAACHVGEGILHRAFSVFIFNRHGELLLQQRSALKPLWPLFWSNSCCSHPRKGEDLEIATQRRLKEELGFTTPLKYLFKFQYQARFNEKGSENELCAVLIGKYDHDPVVNDNEIAAWRWISIDKMEEEMETHPEQFTPWFKMEWERIRREHWEDIRELLES